jgi:hypothetical protein
VITAHTITARPPGGQPLTVKSATVTLDEGWSPYVQGDLLCVIPDPDTLALLDPRTDPPPRLWLDLVTAYVIAARVAQITLDYYGRTLAALSTKYTGRKLSAISADYGTAYNTGVVLPPVTRRFDVHVRSRTTDLVTGELRLTVASDEQLMQDYAQLFATPSTPATNTVRDAVALVLAYTVPGAVLPAGPDAPIDPAAAPWGPGVYGWDYLSPLVTAAELRLWCDESRVWHLDVPFTGTGGTLALAAATNLVRATEDMSRDGDWYAAVYVSWQTTTEAGTGKPLTPGAAAGRLRGRTLAVRYPDTPYPAGLTPSPMDTARALLTRAQTRGRVLTLDALSDYTATPGQAVTVTVPGRVVVAGMVSAVSWGFPDDEMTVRTRDLVDAGVLAHLGVD